MLGFDHHCTWLNNCVGANNNKSFIALLVAHLVHSIVSMVSLLILEDNINVLFWLAAYLLVVRVTPILILLGWNVFLLFRGVTTYTFLTERELK